MTSTLSNTRDFRAVPSKAALWTGRGLSALSVLFLLMDGVMKLVKPAPVLEATQRLGYAESTLTGTGIVLIICTLLYAIPRTSILGAMLLTGYLGGAVATHVRASSTVFEILFPVIFGIVIWGALWLRMPKLRTLLMPVGE